MNKLKIFIYGDSNTWGYVPTLKPYSGDDSKTDRYDSNDIWWGTLKKDYELFVNGNNGRTIANDHPDYPNKNGLASIDKLMPDERIDLSIIMLGTNDLKDMYKLSTSDLIEHLKLLIERIDKKYQSKIMLICPPYIYESPITNPKYSKGIEKINEYEIKLREFTSKNGYLFASGKNSEVGIDGEHLTEKGHKDLGRVVYEVIKKYEDELK